MLNAKKIVPYKELVVGIDGEIKKKGNKI